jgi:dihydroflavonol-4-reductase
MEASRNPLVLVTGASGFVASHIIASLDALGYRCRATVRQLPTRPSSHSNIEYVKADLLVAESWPPAVCGCDFVLHIASPFVLGAADVEATIIRPAVDGTLNVLRAVANCPISKRPRRVVLTSSLSSVAYGRPFEPGRVFTAADWSDPDSTGFGMGPYQRSKTLAERAAWSFMHQLPPEQRFELAAVCPGAILGPLLSRQAGLLDLMFRAHASAYRIPLVVFQQLPSIID